MSKRSASRELSPKEKASIAFVLELAMATRGTVYIPYNFKLFCAKHVAVHAWLIRATMQKRILHVEVVEFGRGANDRLPTDAIVRKSEHPPVMRVSFPMACRALQEAKRTELERFLIPDLATLVLQYSHTFNRHDDE